MLVQVAIALVGLMALSAFVIDYGVLWVARRQAQNSADAAALAAAVSWMNVDDAAQAQQSAVDAGSANAVWGEAPDIPIGEVGIAECPAGATGSPAPSTCARVNLYRNQSHGNALPTFFANLVGVTEQGVRATATAAVLFNDATDCVKPLAIPDRWTDVVLNFDADGSPTFEHYGPGAQPLVPADLYDPPGAGNGTGFTRASDHGSPITLRFAEDPATFPTGSGRMSTVAVNPDEGAGGFLDNILNCDPTMIGPGTYLEAVSASTTATLTAMQSLHDLDSVAIWNSGMNGGRGGVQGGCMATGTCSRSPRLVALPVYDPDLYDYTRRMGNPELAVRRIVGFFIEDVNVGSEEMTGYLTIYPSVPRYPLSALPDAAFVASIALVR